MIVKYQAINGSGTMVADTIMVEDASEAYAELTRRGLTPVHIQCADLKSSAGRSKAALSRVLARSQQADPARASKRHLPFFTTQMSILLETGTTVAAALNAIERQVSCPHWRELVCGMRRHVEEGGSLASAAGQYRHIFDPVYVNMISAGEASGNMGEILHRLAELSRQSDRIRGKVISAMVYPAMLALIATSVVSVLIFFVLPRFEALFEEMKVSLPASTRFFLMISKLVRHHYLGVLLGLAAVVTGVVLWVKSETGRRLIDQGKLKIPAIGSLISSIIIARVFRLIGLLVNSNVTLVEALQLTTNSTKHFMYADLIDRMRDSVLRGGSMYEALTCNKLMPASISEMVHTAEENGKIGQVLSMLADHLDDENETKVSMLTSILEPMILVFMGLIIGTVVISLVLPMFDLSKISG